MSFVPLAIRHGLLMETEGVQVLGWAGAEHVVRGTVFGLVIEPTRVHASGDEWLLRAGSWFVLPEGAHLAGGRGLAIVVPGYCGIRQLGGPLESRGRLRYIDGCSDTLLVCPPRLGEPCLNHLHIPARTEQSSHTHPTLRVGVILRGRGVCRAAGVAHALEPGLGWFIPAGLRHGFSTQDEPLDVLAWHPDSDFGPTDEDHPMKNRTLELERPLSFD